MLSMILPVKEDSEYHRSLSDYAVRNLRATAGAEFELVIVEANGTRLRRDADIHVEAATGCVAGDINEGLGVATGDIHAYTANDHIFEQGWVGALLAPYDCREDCGATTLLEENRGVAEPIIEEAIWQPVTSFHAGWLMDAETFPTIFNDTDLLMRIYREGFRCYRNRAVRVRHLCGGEQTYQTLLDRNERRRRFLLAREEFRQRHEACGLMMYRALYEAWRI